MTWIPLVTVRMSSQDMDTPWLQLKYTGQNSRIGKGVKSVIELSLPLMRNLSY
jgi:hypothetical protein